MQEWFDRLRRVVVSALRAQCPETPRRTNHRKKIVLPLVLQVVGGTILLLVPLAFSAVRRAVVGAFFWLQVPVSISCWLHLLLSALAAAFVLQNVLRWRKQRSIVREPRLEEYRSDRYHDVLWRWKYAGKGKIDEKEIDCYCLQCGRQLLVDTELVQQGASRLILPDACSGLTRLVCQKHGEQRRFPWPYHREQLMARYEFEHKINNDTWKQVVLAQSIRSKRRGVAFPGLFR